VDDLKSSSASEAKLETCGKQQFPWQNGKLCKYSKNL